MPRVKTKTARFDTYRRGLQVPANTKSGTKVDRSQPADEHDTLFCHKGDTYYTWKFRYGGTQRSTTYPRASQLTQSEFLSQAYELGERLGDLDASTYLEDGVIDVDGLKSDVDDVAQEFRQLGEECEEKRGNMPDALQDSETGELLGSRAEACEAVADQLDNIDFTPMEEAATEEEDSKVGDEEEAEPDEDPEATNQFKLEAIEEVLAEVQGIEYEGE